MHFIILIIVYRLNDKFILSILLIVQGLLAVGLFAVGQFPVKKMLVSARLG